MRTCNVEESTGGFNQVAIYVTGGTVDLGVSGDPGGNTFDINDAGSLISNMTATAISALSNNWQSNAVALPDNFAIEDQIRHALDQPGLGLVTWVAANVYPTPSSDTINGAIQRGIDAVSNPGKVNIAGGTYTGNVVAGAPLTKVITLLPGASPAQVVINGNLTLNSSDTLALDINGTTPGTDYDQLVVNGTVTLGGATLSLTLGSVGACAQYTIINNDDVEGVTGIFAGLPNGSTVSGLKIFYNKGTGNDVVLFADATPPTVASCPPGPIELGCNPTPPTCANAVTNVSFSDNCPCTLTTNCVDGGAVQTGCRYTNSFTITATDCAGNTSDPCVATYSWTADTTPPTIQGCPSTPIQLG